MASTSSVTLADVAKAAGVSLATASRALHGASGRTVRPELAARVEKAARDLQYVANAAAQAMSSGRSSSVGLIVHDIADPYAAAVAAGVMAGCADRDLIVTVAATGGDPATEIRHLVELRRQRARAVILAGSRFSDPALQADLAAEINAFTTGGGQIAAIGQEIPGVNTVAVDNYSGGRRMAELLFSLGYRRFAVLAGSEDWLTSEERLAGFRDGIAAVGGELPGEHVLSAQFSRDGGYVAMTELLESGLDAGAVDAVFAINDVMAIGAMAALSAYGIRVPDDIAVAGFDDVPMLRDIRPPLTTVSVPWEDIGRLATDVALHPGDQAIVTHVDIELAVRASTPPRRASPESPSTESASTESASERKAGSDAR